MRILSPFDADPKDKIWLPIKTKQRSVRSLSSVTVACASEMPSNSPFAHKSTIEAIKRTFKALDVLLVILKIA